MRNFGFGARTGVDLSSEAEGVLPLKAYLRVDWSLGKTYHLAIGQNDTATPLQVAVAIAAIANADARTGVAKLVRPHFLKPSNIDHPPDSEAARLDREALELDRPRSEFRIDPEGLRAIREGMWQAVQGDRDAGRQGTAHYAAFPLPYGGFDLESGGKTGTAEWSLRILGVPVKQRPHAWLAVYAPFERPRVVCLVLVPEAGRGSGVCGPIVRDLLKMYFKIQDEPRIEEGALG